jgi:hypothetical protein
VKENGISAEGCATKVDAGRAAKIQVITNRLSDRRSDSPTNQKVMITPPKSTAQLMIAAVATIKVKSVSVLVTDET